MRLAIVALALVPATAHATYSIVATDTATRQVGGAGTSCIGSNSVRIIYGSVPGKGAVHAQAQLGGPGKMAAVMQIGMDAAPTDIITSITQTAFDANAQRRQYGIVDLAMRSAGFSGTQNGAFSGDRQGTLGAFTYSVQGNILTSVAVIDHAETAFRGQGCDLADRLMLALEAGAQNGEGDSRCTPNGIPSDSAFIQVDRDGEAAGTYLVLDVRGTAPASPLPMLRAQYDAWRVTNPCPVVAQPDGVGGGDDMGGCCSSTDGARSLFWVPAAWLVLRRRRRSFRAGA